MAKLFEGKTIVINGLELHVAYAESAEELKTGLKQVTNLQPYDGMLFDFGTRQKVTMTPEGCLIPLDVAFIAGDGRIMEIKRLDPAEGAPKDASAKILYALEVPAGFFDKHQIRAGDIVSIP